MTPKTLIDIRKPRSFFISSPCSCILTTLLSLLDTSSLFDILCLYGVTPLWCLESTVRLAQNKSSLMLWFFIGWAISSTTYTEIFNIHGVLIKNIRFHLGYNHFFCDLRINFIRNFMEWILSSWISLNRHLFQYTFMDSTFIT